MTNESKLAVLCEIGNYVKFLKDEITEKTKNVLIMDGTIFEDGKFLQLTAKGQQIHQACLREFERIN